MPKVKIIHREQCDLINHIELVILQVGNLNGPLFTVCKHNTEKDEWFYSNVPFSKRKDVYEAFAAVMDQAPIHKQIEELRQR